MTSTRLLVAAGVAGALGLAPVLVTGTGASAATPTAMIATKTGKITKLESAHAFVIKVGEKTYVVKIDAMTQLKVGGKLAKLSALKRGDTVRVKGTVEMDTITATAVTEEM